MIITQKSLLRAFCLAVLVTALPVTALAQQRRAAAQNPPSAPVTVVNTTANPVPTTATVSGTVNIGNTPNVNVANTPTVNIGTMPGVTGMVSISGTPNVNVTGTPNVNVNTMPPVSLVSTANVKVNNTDSNPVPVRLTNGGGFEPYHCNEGIDAWVGYEKVQLLCGLVQSGKRLVIEYVSAHLQSGGLLSGQLWVGIETTAGGTAAIHYLPLTQSTPNTAIADRHVGGQVVRIYADQGTGVNAHLYNGSSLIPLSGRIAFSGHLEPI
jgi:hypothetical protein